MDRIEVTIGTETLTDVSDGTLSTDIEHACSQLRFTRASSSRAVLSVVGLCGAEVAMFRNGKRMFSGYLDAPAPDAGADKFKTTCTARSATQDLVDSSVEGPISRINVRLHEVLRLLIAEPFGLPLFYQHGLRDALDSITVPKFAVAANAKALEEAGKLARDYGFLVTDDEDGRAYICRAGTGRASDSLVFGGPNANVDDMKPQPNYGERYSRIQVYSQRARAKGMKATHAAFNTGAAIDDEIRRYRFKAITAEHGLDAASCRRLAQWEVSTRRAKSMPVQARIPGWTQRDGTLWTKNLLVPVSAPDFFGASDLEMLIRAVSYAWNEKSQACTLTLIDPRAYTPKPMKSEHVQAGRAYAPIDDATKDRVLSTLPISEGGIRAR